MSYYERVTTKIKNVVKKNVYPPKFNKKRWRLIKQVNCYAYALDLPVRDRKMEIFIPGCISNPDVIPAIFNPNELITRLKEDLDFLGLSYREDNGKLKKGEWRIPEKTLITIAMIGGCIGGIAGMYMFRHKTHKARFSIGFPVILGVQITLIFFCVTKYDII